MLLLKFVLSKLLAKVLLLINFAPAKSFFCVTLFVSIINPETKPNKLDIVKVGLGNVPCPVNSKPSATIGYLS